MHFDVVIIGAGMSGLAAGIRLAYFGHRVRIFERHYAFGGLNSYYTLEGRAFDVGLHAVTNIAPPERRGAPLNKLLRQLRLSRDELGLLPQRHSEVLFPGRRLRFTNDAAVLIEEVSREFPQEADNFRRLVAFIGEYDDARLDLPWRSTRAVLGDYVRDPVLVDMLLCPIFYYGSPEEHDLDFTSFVTLFKAIFLEGFARPREGVRRIIRALVRTFHKNGGTIKMRSGVRRLIVEDDRVQGIELENGETISADVVLSSIGLHETMALCGTESGQEWASEFPPGQISFVESIAVLDTLPQKFGWEAAIAFYNDAERFTYAVPDGPIDPRSGVICAPSNYEGHEDMAEGVLRMTWMAHPRRWIGVAEDVYAAQKAEVEASFRQRAERIAPGIARHIVFMDTFTPRTIRHYTGHENGAVYGTTRKARDGRTPWANLFLCGTDQGYLGIIGAMLSGITVANMHVLGK
ncbi:MAG: NAD(P)/FAD-dependent oxidoreductase [Phycisphaerae bacterium]|nr:NAD(P)/FAD-dependent oxidoreductase [Phycisphaerae bacterium]